MKLLLFISFVFLLIALNLADDSGSEKIDVGLDTVPDIGRPKRHANWDRSGSPGRPETRRGWYDDPNNNPTTTTTRRTTTRARSPADNGDAKRRKW